MHVTDYKGPVILGTSRSGPSPETQELRAALLDSLERQVAKVLPGTTRDDYKKLAPKIRNNATKLGVLVSVGYAKDGRIAFEAHPNEGNGNGGMQVVGVELVADVRPPASEVREWAARKGVEISPRGRISDEMLERYSEDMKKRQARRRAR